MIFYKQKLICREHGLAFPQNNAAIDQQKGKAVSVE
jgi:hypothetical protein